jgi:predicted  nucleic acid-binding Zn-ribbon protein
MNMDDERREGKIFPELREAAPARESGNEPAGRAAEPARETSSVKEGAIDWREQPLPGREPEARAREIRRPVAVKNPSNASTEGLWLAFTFLLLVLAGAGFYGYETLQDANIQMSQIPPILKSMATANGRLDNLESQMNGWSGYMQGLSGRMDKIQRQVRADYRGARRHAETLTAQLEKQIQQKMEARDRVVDARLGRLDAAQKDDDARVAELKQQLGNAQNQLAALRRETDGDLSLLHRRVDGNQQQVNDLSRTLARRRVNFEVSKNRIAQLSTDISMDLTATDISYQRFSGWVYFEPDGRYLWVRDQGVAQPVVFYDQQQGKQYQVVITSLRQSSAAGYLLLPGADGAQTEAAGGMSSGR